MATVALAEDFTARFPSLTSSPAFMSQRAAVGLAGFERCFEASTKDGADCTDRFLAYLKVDKANVDFAMKAGRLVIRKQAPYMAVSFFREAVAGSSNPARECADSELQRAVAAGITLPEHALLYGVARELQRACPNN